MAWFNSTNAKEIGTLYLIFAVFAGMIGTAFSVLIRLELSSPGVQYLQGDHLSTYLLFLPIIQFFCAVLPIVIFFLYIAFPRLIVSLSFLYKKWQNILVLIQNLKQINLFKILGFMDYILFVLVISFFIFDLVQICAYFVDTFSLGTSDCFLQMNNNSGTPNDYGFIINSAGESNTGGNPGGSPQGNHWGSTSHRTDVKIIPDDGSWSSAIRNLFIYGTGGARMWMNLTRGGTPSQRLFIITSTILAEGASKILQNSMNDPGYILANITNLKTIWVGTDSAKVILTEPVQQVITTANSSSSGFGATGGTGEIAKSLIGVDLGQIFDTIRSEIGNYLNYLFEPVHHTFTTEIMSNHVQNISLLLILLTVIICIFFISLLFNITLFIFSDKLIKYFTIKYIIAYIKLNKKIIAFEIITLSGWIGYLLYIIITSLHYIATHPVVFC